MKAQNKAGTWFALKVLKNGNALVYKLCSNYSLGCITKQWRCVQPTRKMSHLEFQKMAREGLELEIAKKLFDKIVEPIL